MSALITFLCYVQGFLPSNNNYLYYHPFNAGFIEPYLLSLAHLIREVGV
jgi:hypothetical protein